jgi:hypothetical protein
VFDVGCVGVVVNSVFVVEPSGEHVDVGCVRVVVGPVVVVGPSGALVDVGCAVVVVVGPVVVVELLGVLVDVDASPAGEEMGEFVLSKSDVINGMLTTRMGMMVDVAGESSGGVMLTVQPTMPTANSNMRMLRTALTTLRFLRIYKSTVMN